MKRADKKSGGRIYKFLRTKGKKYRSRGVSIDDRPKIVDEKSRIGDWEIDTLIGKNHKQALVTIVERKSKFSLMRKGENKTAELVATATIELLRPDKDRVLPSPRPEERSLPAMRKWPRHWSATTILLLCTPVGSLD